MKLRTKIIAAAAALSAATVLGVGAIANTTSKVFADGAHTYSCVDITMTETVSNPGSYKTTNAETFSVLHGIAEGELSTTWTNANYAANVNGDPASAIKIGGSKAEKYDGSIVLSFKTYEVSRVIVYAAAWNKDAAPNLTVGDQYYPLPTTADNAYSFKPYTFDFDATSTITLTNGSGNSSSHRIVISKIVFKVTGSTTPIDSSTSAETSSEPEDTSTEPQGEVAAKSTIIFADKGLENGVQYSDPFEFGDCAVVFTGGGNDGKYYTTGSGIRTYGNGSITVSSSKVIQTIVFTWSGNYKPEADVASPSGYNITNSTWTGTANEVTLTRPSGSGNWRLQSITVN